MKIGIMTITCGQNYGNRLQNYALQEILKSMGHEVETVWNGTGAWEQMNSKFFLKKYIQKYLHLKYTPQVERMIRFYEFNKKYISWSRFQVSKGSVPSELKSAYDKFVTGSDQVWNPFYDRTCGIDFLSFADAAQRVSYAASIGVSEIEEKHEKMFRKYLKDFPGISVREEAGSKLLEKLLDREVPVVPDPTIVLDKKKWDSFMKKPAKVDKNKKYILTYLLNDNEKAEKDVEYLRKKYNCEVINLYDCYEDKFDQPYYFSMDPAEFIWLIAHAKVFITDSFHGSVFSILYNTNFIVYERKTKHVMGSRISQLMNMFGLEERFSKADAPTDFSILEKPFDVTEKLAKEREKGLSFLKKAIGE